MEGTNRALKADYIIEKSFRTFSGIEEKLVPCFFICYQRKDEIFAKKVAEYILYKTFDVYFDLEDNDLKQKNQSSDPKFVTNAIRIGLNKSDYMIVIVSPNTYKSLWVPFEIGYAYDKIKDANMKILRHKEIERNSMPAYLSVKEILHGTTSLNKFLNSIRKQWPIYEDLLEKGEQIKTFSEYQTNPLNKYLDNE